MIMNLFPSWQIGWDGFFLFLSEIFLFSNSATKIFALPGTVKGRPSGFGHFYNLEGYNHKD